MCCKTVDLRTLENDRSTPRQSLISRQTFFSTAAKSGREKIKNRHNRRLECLQFAGTLFPLALSAR